MVLQTIDPAVWLPALKSALHQPGASENHATMSSEDWIKRYLVLGDMDLALRTKIPYGHASLALLLLRHGVKGGRFGCGPQIDPNDVQKTAVEERLRLAAQECWQNKVAERRELALVDETLGRVTYWWDSSKHRFNSCTNTLDYFYVYPSRQTHGLGLHSPSRDTAEENRIYYGCVRIPLNNGEFYVHHRLHTTQGLPITSSSRMRLF